MLFAVLFSGCKKEEEPDPAPATTSQPGALVAPSLIAPPSGVTGLWVPITFSWNAVAGAEYYEGRSWYYSNGGGQSNFILSAPNYISTTQTISSPLGAGFHGKTIYWHVRASRNNFSEYGPWSPTYSFVLQ